LSTGSLLNSNVTPFVPSGSLPLTATTAAPFKPTNQPAQGMSVSAANFPAPQSVNPTPAKVVKPTPAKIVKPVEPPKEKYVLLIERIVKASDEDVKSADIKPEEQATINKIKDTVDRLKSEKKITLHLLKNFVD